MIDFSHPIHSLSMLIHMDNWAPDETSFTTFLHNNRAAVVSCKFEFFKVSSALDPFLKLKQSLCCNAYWIFFFLNVLNKTFLIVEWWRYFLWQTKALKNNASVKRSVADFIQKNQSSGVIRKRCSENMKQIYRWTLRPKCHFNKVVLHVRTPMEGCFCLLSLSLPSSLHLCRISKN